MNAGAGSGSCTGCSPDNGLSGAPPSVRTPRADCQVASSNSTQNSALTHITEGQCDIFMTNS